MSRCETGDFHPLWQHWICLIEHPLPARHLTELISFEHPGGSRKQFSREISSLWHHVAVQRERGGFAPRLRLYLKDKALSLNQIAVLVARGSLARAPLAWPLMQRLSASPRAKRRAQGHGWTPFHICLQFDS